MPLLWVAVAGLAVGGGTGYFLGLETNKLLKLTAIAGIVYVLWKKGIFK